MSKDIQVTQEGYDKLKAELEDLKGPVRLAIAEAIREAKSHGDLRENAAYHEAKLNQTRLEKRISDLERAIQYAKVVERPADAGNAAFLGSKVTLLDLEFDDEFFITLVGAFEADPSNDLISIDSPLGLAVQGHEAGDEIVVDAPAGKQTYRILKVE
ncbi:MAG: transcription elongation factor GreA [Fimbriimonadaceae bacterium]|nr:transcription elongation factor GreA [Fimbriimonadaceae bacterium]